MKKPRIRIILQGSHTAIIGGGERGNTDKKGALGRSDHRKPFCGWTHIKICKSIDGLGYLFLDFLCLLL